MSTYTFDLPPYDPLDDLAHHHQPTESTSAAPTLSAPQLIKDESPSTTTVTLRMPTDLVNQVDILARQEDISRSQAMRRITSYVLQAIRNDPESIKEYGRVASRLYDEACEIVRHENELSVSLLQRHLRLDYHIAVLLKDELERTGMVPRPDARRHQSPILDD